MIHTHLQRAVTTLAMLVVGTILAGCAAGPSVPPIPSADSSIPQHGKFIWHDLITEDLGGVKSFYGELLGWTFEDTDWPNYTVIRLDGKAIGGIVDLSAKRSDVNESQWISLLSVPDVDRAVRETREAGGELHVGPIDVDGRGRLAVVSDPQGAVVAYIRSRDGDPPDRTARIGEWLWTELWTADVEASSEFYGGLVDYELNRVKILDDIDYVVFRRGKTPRAGVIPRPIEEIRANWLPYVRVGDPTDLVGRVEQLGGKVLLEPRDEIRKGTVAIVIDPSGAAVALQQWDTEASS